MKTRLVVKLSIVLVALLAIVLYKINDYFKDEKLNLAQVQIHNRIISLKTSVAGQLSQTFNILSSYETEIIESKINWVQLAPFFVLASAQADEPNQLKILNIYARSGSLGERWNKAYLQKALTIQKNNFQPDTVVHVFRDQAGSKYMALNFRTRGASRLIVAGSADYFQKYFDLDRGGRLTSGLLTTGDMLAAHSQADYVASLSKERNVSTAKYLSEVEEIAGTNLSIFSYSSKKAIAPVISIPWSVVGLVFGFGLVIVALLNYGLMPMEKRIERYRSEEKKQIFEQTMGQSLSPQSEQPLQSAHQPSLPPEPQPQPLDEEVATSLATPPATGSSLRERIELKARELVPDNEEVAEATLVGPLQQALFNLDRKFKTSKVHINKNITSSLTFEIPYKRMTRAFEELFLILVNWFDDGPARSVGRLIHVHLTDRKQSKSVIEVFSTSWSGELQTTLSEIQRLFESLGLQTSYESLNPGFKIMISMERKTVEQPHIPFIEVTAEPTVDNTNNWSSMMSLPEVSNEQLEPTDDLDLDKILALDEVAEEFIPKHIKVVEDKTQMIASSAPQELHQKSFQTPNVSLTKKNYRIDNLEITVRRPEK